jgi:hypothetical protein
MQNETQAKGSRKRKWAGCLAGILLVVALAAAGYLALKKGSPEPRPAPEAEKVLAAQTALPFQVLIPAYLPAAFEREKIEIRTDASGPDGEAMVELTYTTRGGIRLVLSEWMPRQPAGSTDANRGIRCLCRSETVCDMFGVEVNIGQVRIKAILSVPNVLTYEQMQLILQTLGPAANRLAYAKMAEVPVSYSFPPAVDTPLNAQGIQELTLVVSPQGYTPVHFAVKKGVPVRLVFRQLGEVGCGNELLFEWGKGQAAKLLLASPTDQQVLEFTPEQSGEFRFNCPHLIYRGVMTVTD